MKNIFKLLFTASILLFAYGCTTDGEHLASYDQENLISFLILVIICILIFSS